MQTITGKGRETTRERKTLLRALLIEESDKMASLLLGAIEQGGFKPEVQRVDSAAALRTALEAKTWDVILADYSMPGFNALKALEVLQQSGRDLPFIVISGKSGEDSAVAAMRAGASDYVLKENLSRLMPAIEREMREVSERSRRRSAEQRFHDLVQSLDAIVWEADAATGKFTFINKRAEMVLGYPVRDWLKDSRFWSDHLHPEDQPRATGMKLRAIQERTDYKDEYRMIARDGNTIWLRDRVHVVCDARGKPQHLRGVMLDSTERKQLEQQIQHVQKMEAIGRLGGGIAHDFNNLLMIIMGRAELLARHLPVGETNHDHVIEINKASQRAATLTRQLLAFSRKQVLSPRVMNLNTAITSMRDTLASLMGEQITLSFLLDASLGSVKADPRQIEQVLLNLGTNAHDAMPDKGRLTIATRNLDLDKGGHSEQPGLPPGRYVRLTITDTGCGMDAQVMAHLFEPFYTTKEIGKGSGLGLCSIYGIVHQSGGHIFVTSHPGKGTSFKIYLPRVEGPIEKHLDGDSPTTPMIGDETILLVEDEENVRNLVHEMICMYGYFVMKAAHGDEALRLCNEHKGRIHLMLSDLAMPGMNGKELAQQVARLRPETRVIFMSGYASDAILPHNLLEKDTVLLRKPFTPDDLARKLREVLDAPVKK